MQKKPAYAELKKGARGFTLIELLVVIAIIAMLLSIILPALRRVKESAKSLLCQTNTKGLVAAWHAYASENDDFMPGSWNYHPVKGWGGRSDWAWSPWDAAADAPTWTDESYVASLKERQEGIAKGSIFPYVENYNSYHCPSDKSSGGNIRSYSIPDTLNGRWGQNNLKVAGWDNLQRVSEVESPGSKYVFIEENDPRGYNINSWVINPGATSSDSWGDPMALWHFSHNNLAFADGHTEEWKWSRETLGFFGNIEAWSSSYPRPETPEGIEDLKRVQRGWPD